MRSAVIVDAVRTAVGKGKPGGALSGLHPVDLYATTLRALVDRVGLDPALVEDAITGCVSQVGEQSVNLGRNAVLSAGFPAHVPATTIDRQCGSSQQAVHFAAQWIMAGSFDVVIAGGAELMSRVPLGSSSMGKAPRGSMYRERFADGLPQSGSGGRIDCGAMETLPRRAGRIRCPLPPSCSQGSGSGILRERDRADRRPRRFRRHRDARG